MDIITLDFETYFDNDFTLTKMTTEEYVRDPRFEAHGCAIDWRHYPDARCDQVIWYDRELLPEVLLQIDWSDTALVCHHMHFDGLILSHHYGIVPKLYACTMSMARALLGPNLGKSLEDLSGHFNLPPKSTPYNLFRGYHWHQLTPEVQQQVSNGACREVRNIWTIFEQMSKVFPAEEFSLVDATIRMFTTPRLVGNTEKLGEVWYAEENKKRQLLASFIEDFASHPEISKLKTKDPEELIRKDWVFAALLRQNGVEPEQKRMKDGKCKTCKGDGQVAAGFCTDCNGTGEVVRYKYAFAKTDDFMRDLLDNEDEDLRLMAEAKLAASSSGTQTRTARLGNMSTRGAMCVYLNYCGTHVKGWSGGDKTNWQNMRRGGPIAGTIEAPPGCMLVIADASQCEARLLEEVAGEDMTDWREGKDPYTSLASKFYEEEIYKPAKDDPRRFEMEEKRGTGKQLRLSCGYGAGDNTIQATAKKGLYGPPVYLTIEQARNAKDLYRREKAHVTLLWKEANDVLKKMHSGLEFEWGPVYIQNKRMWFPNGLAAIYETLKWEDDPEDGGDAGWRVRVNKNGWSKMYGAKLVENLIQGLRNVLIRQAWLRCAAQGLDMVSMEHDKLIACVKESDAEDALHLIQFEMTKSPVWLPNVPLDSEGFISRTFAKPER